MDPSIRNRLNLRPQYTHQCSGIYIVLTHQMCLNKRVHPNKWQQCKVAQEHGGMRQTQTYLKKDVSERSAKNMFTLQLECKWIERSGGM